MREKYILRLITIFSINILLLIGNLKGEVELRGSKNELKDYFIREIPTTTLTVENETKITANQAILTLKITTEDQKLSKALRKNTTKKSNIIKFLSNNGFDKDGIISERFSSIPKQSWSKDKVKRYLITNYLKITIIDGPQFEVLARIVDENKEVKYDSIQFKHSDEENHKNDSIEKAISKLNNKKSKYEKGFSISLKLTDIIENAFVINNAANIPQPNYSNSRSKVNYLSEVDLSAVAQTSNSSGFNSFGEIIYKTVLTGQYRLN